MCFCLCSFFLIGQKTIMIYNPESTLKAKYNLECLMREFWHWLKILSYLSNVNKPQTSK